MAFTSFQNQATSDATQVTQIIDALQGTAGQGQPIALTALSDATNPALQVRNQDSTNGKCQEWLDAAGAVMGRVIGTTTGYFEFLKKLTLTIGTVTTGQNHLGITATWNASGETFKGIFANITNTASHANSRLIDLQVGGTTQFNVTAAGAVTCTGAVAATGAVSGSNIPALGVMGAVAANHHVESGRNYAAGNTAVVFANEFASTPSVIGALTVRNAVKPVVDCGTITTTGFTINVVDGSDSDKVDWIAEGADA